MDQVLESRYVQMQDGRKWTKEKFCRKVKVCSTDFFKKNLLRNNNFNHCIWSKLVQTTQNALYFIHSSLTVTILYLKHFSLGPTCNNRRTVRQVNWSEENLLAFFNLTWTILKTTRFKSETLSWKWEYTNNIQCTKGAVGTKRVPTMTEWIIFGSIS